MPDGFEEGEVFLKRGHQVYRLSWRNKEGDRRRSLPAGTYRVTGYRIALRDGHGHPWFISATSPGYRTLKIEAGRETRLAVDPRIHVRLKAKRENGRVRVACGILGEAHSEALERHRRIGLTIYKDGRRIEALYRLRDREGRVLAEGKLRYG